MEAPKSAYLLEMKLEYSVEKWTHGWLICARPGECTVPIDAITESMPLFGRDAVMLPEVAHHFNEHGHLPWVVFAVATPPSAKRWMAEIDASIQMMPPEERWWKGPRVGASSAAIFAILAEGACWKARALDHSKGGPTPRDSGDFERCMNLLKEFPAWRSRLSEVAAAYPDTSWPAIIARWDEIENASPKERYDLLREIDAQRGSKS